MTPRIFVTGATGYLGSAIVARLARAGAEIHALSRSAERLDAFRAETVRPVVGTLANPDWIATLKNCDTVLLAHAADSGENPSELDQFALDAVRAAALDGRVRTLVYMSGAWQYGDRPGEIIDEHSVRKPQPLVSWRAAHEEIALDMATHEVRSLVLQPGIVYGEHRGILGGWFREARAQGTITQPGQGAQHWPLVHRDDVAEAVALALEHGKGGERWILADGSHHTVRELSAASAAATGARVVVMHSGEVRESLGDFGTALLGDLRVSAAKAHRELGWVPRHTSFVAEAPALWREWQHGREATIA